MKYWEIIVEQSPRYRLELGLREASEMTTEEIMKEAQEISASDEQLYDLLEANVGKLLDQSLVNEIFEMFRDWACRLEPAHVGNGQTPPSTD